MSYERLMVRGEDDLSENRTVSHKPAKQRCASYHAIAVLGIQSQRKCAIFNYSEHEVRRDCIRAHDLEPGAQNHDRANECSMLKIVRQAAWPFHIHDR